MKIIRCYPNRADELIAENIQCKLYARDILEDLEHREPGVVFRLVDDDYHLAQDPPAENAKDV